MTSYTQSDAMDALDPFFEDLDAICRSALGTYRGYPPEVRIEHDRRAQASCIYCHMANEADRRLNGRGGVVPLEHRNLKLWAIEDVVTIRFKKMDEDGRTRNYPTKQAIDYDAQLPLPGLPLPPVNLVVGYLLDPTETEIERIQVARPMGRKMMDWCAALVPTSDQVEGRPRWVDVTRQTRAL